MKGIVVAGVAGLVGIGGVIGAGAAMEPSDDPVVMTAAAPAAGNALDDRIARLADARRAIEDSRSASRSRGRTTTTVEDRVAAPGDRERGDDGHRRRGRGSDDGPLHDRFDDHGGDRVDDDDRDDDRSGRGRGRGRGGDDD